MQFLTVVGLKSLLPFYLLARDHSQLPETSCNSYQGTPFSFKAKNGEFPSCCVSKIKMTNLRPQEFHNSNLMYVHHSSLRLAYQHTFSNSNPLFGIFLFHPPVWTTSVQQMQSDQVSRALAQKEVPQSTTLSSLLTIRVLKPLGLRWCTLTGRDGGPRCPKVSWWGIFVHTTQTHSQSKTPPPLI